MLLPLDRITASKTYVAGEFPADTPLLIVVDPPGATPIVVTLPEPSTFGLSAGQAKLLAFIRVANGAAPVSVNHTIVGNNRLRSQPGTSGWNANLDRVFIGASQTLADEAVVTITVEGGDGSNGRNLMFVDGIVRETA